MKTYESLTGIAVPSTDDASQRVIQEKTKYWQQDGPAINYLKVSGIRPRVTFAPVYHAMLAQIPPQSKVLDVGCGHGRLAIPLAEAGHTVAATDVSQKMLDLLVEHKGALPIDVRLGDAHRIAADDGEFDVVLSSDLMPHFPDWPRLLQEKARVCRPGGLVLFAFNFTEHKIYAASFGGDAFDHPYSADVNSKKPFWAECELDEMITAGRKAGLNLLQTIPIKFLQDSYAFGGALGAAAYRSFQTELAQRIESNLAVSEFFAWLEKGLFQRLPFFAAYSSLVIFERMVSAGSDEPARSAPVAVPAPAATPAVSAAPVVTEKFLNEIPSETSVGERKYLYNYFANQWDGKGTIVEIGPFLGGTTRAIAAGMAANPHRAAGTVLHTFDRFDDYYAPEKLRQTVEPMVRGGVFTASQANDLCRDANFERLFDAIHSPHDYGRLVQLHNSPLPDRPEEIDGSTSLGCLAGETKLGALFIDGCKSWASTHYAMKFLLPRLSVGAPVIFQDYGWYTCFWISSLTHALREYFTPVSHVDSTYTFRLTRPITANDVAKRFARTPVEMGEVFFQQSAAALLKRSRRDLDLRAELIAQLHHVAALMTIGHRGAAADILMGLDVKRYAAFANMIRGCIKSPTYLPSGKQILWEEVA